MIEFFVIMWAIGFMCWMWTLGLLLLRWNYRRGGGDT